MKFLQLLIIAAVSLALFACGEDSYYVPVSNATASINANGGAGVNGSGEVLTDGYGGGLDVYSYGDIKISKSGYPDAAVAAYADYKPNYGANKVTVSADTTVQVDPGGVPAAGVLFVVTGYSSLYVGDGVNATGTVVTGLEVSKGATLQLPTNFIWLPNAVVINGTVANTVESASIDLESDSLLVVGKTGKVTTAATTAGLPGGEINLNYNSPNGVLVNLGAVDCSGASGGPAGSAYLYADGVIFNSGSVTAKGGDGDRTAESAYTSGGQGGNIYIRSFSAKIFSSGALNANGGAGVADGAGGQAGIISIFGSTEVDLVYLSINLNGGGGTANGGAAGQVNISSGIIFALDKTVAPAAASITGSTAYSITNDVPINAKGGSGALSGRYTGGAGGYVNVGQFRAVSSPRLAKQIKGAGGYVNVALDKGPSFAGTTNVTNSGAIDISGGTGDLGGNGGGLFFIAENHTTNSGAITANGGTATTNGGNGGEIDLFSGYTLPTTNSGALSVVKGSGGTTAINGTIKIDGVNVTPASGIM